MSSILLPFEVLNLATGLLFQSLPKLNLSGSLFKFKTVQHGSGIVALSPVKPV